MGAVYDSCYHTGSEDGTLPAEIPAECSLPLKGGMPQWAPSPPHLQHSEMPHRSQRPIVAEAQCPAALLQCSSFTGAVKRGCTLGSGSVTAPLQGLAVPSLFLAHWWKSHAHQVLAPWISQHPQTARVGPCSPLHPAELGRWVPAPATSQGVTRVPWPQAAPSGTTTLLCQAHGYILPCCLFI